MPHASDRAIPFPLMLVDDHPVVLFGLRLLFAEHPRFRVVAEALDATAAREAAERLRPGFAVVDLVMGGRDGAALVEDLLAIHPPLRLLVYSSVDDADVVRSVLRLGASGFLSKAAGLDDVARALERVASGETVGDVAARARTGGQDLSDAPTFSLRESQVLDLIGRGHALQGVARQLSLSVKTVGTYRERLKIKLGLDTARDLERYAEERAARRPPG